VGTTASGGRQSFDLKERLEELYMEASMREKSRVGYRCWRNRHLETNSLVQDHESSDHASEKLLDFDLWLQHSP
jgi:hypothetical protein